MNAVVCHMSALRYLDRCARTSSLRWKGGMPKPFDDNGAIDLAYRKQQLQGFDFTRFRQNGKPVDILVPSYTKNSEPKGFKFHRAGAPLGHGALLDADKGILLSSPELTFVQVCRGLPLIRCIKLGSFICGVYSKDPSTRSGVSKRAMLATRDGLEAFVKDNSSLYGAKLASKASPWVLENAASPQETELALKFYLPEELGGKGYAFPVLNYEVPLSPKEQALSGAEHFRVDVCWPEYGVGFEYNSYAEHSEGRKIADDEMRKLILREYGIYVELVTKQQLDDPRQVELLAHVLDDHGVPRVR